MENHFALRLSVSSQDLHVTPETGLSAMMRVCRMFALDLVAKNEILACYFWYEGNVPIELGLPPLHLF